MKLKPNCECCDKNLPAEQSGAVVCSFECSFCADCAENLLAYRCPNCGGELVARPRRTIERQQSHPSSTERVNKRHRCLDYQEDEQQLRTTTGVLYGSLLLPACKPKAWVLLIAGSGPTDRQGNSPGSPQRNNCLRYLALDLATQGIASLRYDKRGVGASAAACSHEATLNFDHYVDDAKAWLAHLRLKASGPVSVLGHSEGAQIATRVAEKLSVASVVNLCGAGRPLDELLLEQLKKQLPPDLYQKAEQILAYLHELSLHEQYRKAAKPGLLRRRSNSLPKAPDVPPELNALFKPSKHAFYISRLRERPDRELETLKCPVLIVSGDADIQVPLHDYERLIQAAPNASKLRIAGMNHLLKPVGTDANLQHKSYVDAAMPIDASLVAAVSKFLIA